MVKKIVFISQKYEIIVFSCYYYMTLLKKIQILETKTVMILKGWKKKSDSDQKYLFQNLEGFMKKNTRIKIKIYSFIKN